MNVFPVGPGKLPVLPSVLGCRLLNSSDCGLQSVTFKKLWVADCQSLGVLGLVETGSGRLAGRAARLRGRQPEARARREKGKALGPSTRGQRAHANSRVGLEKAIADTRVRKKINFNRKIDQINNFFLDCNFNAMLNFHSTLRQLHNSNFQFHSFHLPFQIYANVHPRFLFIHFDFYFWWQNCLSLQIWST